MKKPTTKRRGPRADSLEFAIDAAEAATLPPLEPPRPLPEKAMWHWPRLIAAKRRELWTESDLDSVWRLCLRLAEQDECCRMMIGQPPIIKNSRTGEYEEHPLRSTMEKNERIIQATKRHLQINSAAVNGPSHHLAGKNERARTIAFELDDDDDLFA